MYCSVFVPLDDNSSFFFFARLVSFFKAVYALCREKEHFIETEYKFNLQPYCIWKLFFFCTQLRDERRIRFYWHNHNIVHPHFQELIVRWCIQAASTNDISITFQVFSYSSSFDIENTALPAIQTGYLLTNRAVLASFIQIPLYYFLFTKCTRLTQTVTFQ